MRFKLWLKLVFFSRDNNGFSSGADEPTVQQLQARVLLSIFE
jgi:hypothetical protein